MREGLRRLGMDCTEHERLEQVLIDKRAEARRAAPAPDTEEFQRFHLAESRALEDLKDHDAGHGQRAG
jgi:hypothetical protein